MSERKRMIETAKAKVVPVTPEYRLRTNRIHSKLKTLCHRWMVKHEPGVVERFRKQVKREAGK